MIDGTRWIAGLILLVVASCGRLMAGGPNVPEWVHQAAAAKVPEVDREIQAVILLDEETITVGDDGRAVRLKRRVLKIVRPQGRDYARVYVPFDAQSKVDFVRIWTLNPDGREFELKDKEIGEIGLDMGDEMYSDVKAKAARALNADAGSVVAYEYQVHERPYFNEEYFYLQDDETLTLQKHITLQLPHGWEYKTAWLHAPVVEPVRVGDNGWMWDIHPMAAVREEPMAPNFYAVAARMMITYYGGGVAPMAGDWKYVGRWYSQLSAGRSDTNPEISTKATELLAGRSSFVDKLDAITTFLQEEVRYFGIEVGIGGWQPHAAGDVYHHRYGDCKDKTTLLIAMLRTANIPAHYLLVDHRRGVVAPEVPSAHGDHMITAIEIPDGVTDRRLEAVVKSKSGKRLLIFDPTNQELPVGQLANNLQGSYGLMADGAESELLHLPVLDPEQNVVSLKGRFTLSAEGELKGEVAQNFSGPASSRLRTLFHAGNEQEERRDVERLLRQDLSSFTLEDFGADNVGQRNKDLVLHYKLTAQHYSKKTGSLLLVRPRVMGSDEEPVDLDRPRVQDVQFSGKRLQTEDFTVMLPPGFVVDDLPEPVQFETAFASYSSKTELKGNELHFQREFRVKELTVPAAQYKEFVKALRQIGNDERNQAILKAAS